MEDQAKFEGWAEVQVMGHQSHIGHVTTQAFGGAVLFRIDRPGLPEEEITLDRSEWVDDKRAPVGSIVKKPALEPVSVLVGAGSIYRIIPCTEAAAMVAIRNNTTRPLMLVKLADDFTTRLLATALHENTSGFPDKDDDEDGDRDLYEAARESAEF